MDVEIKPLLQDLQAAGWRQGDIAARIGIGQAAISKLATGRRRDMMFSNAKKLLALHAEVCGPAPVAGGAAEPVAEAADV